MSDLPIIECLVCNRPNWRKLCDTCALRGPERRLHWWLHHWLTPEKGWLWESNSGYFPFGRPDFVRRNAEGRVIDIYEVKITDPRGGIRQLVLYAAGIEPRPRLTLAVPFKVATEAVKDLAHLAGVNVAALHVPPEVIMPKMPKMRLLE